mgnify:CR=1 FL=1
MVPGFVRVSIKGTAMPAVREPLQRQGNGSEKDHPHR